MVVRGMRSVNPVPAKLLLVASKLATPVRLCGVTSGPAAGDGRVRPEPRQADARVGESRPRQGRARAVRTRSDRSGCEVASRREGRPGQARAHAGPRQSLHCLAVARARLRGARRAMDSCQSLPGRAALRGARGAPGLHHELRRRRTDAVLVNAASPRAVAPSARPASSQDRSLRALAVRFRPGARRATSRDSWRTSSASASRTHSQKRLAAAPSASPFRRTSP